MALPGFDRLADDIADSSVEFDASAWTAGEPRRMVYQAGYGEAYPFLERRGPDQIEDPDMPGYPIDVHTEPLPAGFGAYESGEQFPWGNLKHTPAELSYAGQNGGQTEPDPGLTLVLTPWFGHGYEPPWSANEPGQGYASGDNERGFDEYGDPLDDLFKLPDLASSMGEGWNVGMTYDLNSPASVLGLAITVCDREEEQQSKQQVEMTTSFILRGERVYLFQPQTVSDSAGLLHPRMFPVRPAAADRRLRTDSD